jgi:hypothetical protein
MNPYSEKYYEKYLKDWVKSFDNAIPVVLTDKEAQEEENEILNSEKQQSESKPQTIVKEEVFRESMYEEVRPEDGSNTPLEEVAVGVAAAIIEESKEEVPQ